MCDQHLYKSPAIEVRMVTADYYSESVLLIVFLQSGVEKLLAWAAGD